LNSKATAQQRADDIRVFQAELARLRDEGALTLTDEQRERLARHHEQLLASLAGSFDIDRSAPAKQLSAGMRVASLLGALALAASVFFLFYQFWGGFSEAQQVAVLAGGSLATWLLAMAVRERDASGYFTNLCAMVAFACFVLNVSLLGSAFNLPPSDGALLAWAALALLLAYSCGSRLLLQAGIVCLMGFIAARVGAWGGSYWLDLGDRPENFLPAGALLFVLPSVVSHDRFPGFAPILRVYGLLGLFLPMLVLSFAGFLSYIDAEAGTIRATYQVAGFALGAATAWLGIRRGWPAVFNTGVTFFVIFLYTKFFEWWWDWMPKYLFFLVIGLSAILVLFILQRLRGARSAMPAARPGGQS
jgi:hypothetical protein